MSISYPRYTARSFLARLAAVVLGLSSVAFVLAPVPIGAAQDQAQDQAHDQLSPYASTLMTLLEAFHGLPASEPPPEPAPAEPRPCRYAGEGDIPTLVAAIFRCHLRAAGVDEQHVDRIAAEAVTVSHCESLWDPAAVVFNGRYRDVPHPNGNRYSAAGVFQFIRKTANKWINGGYSNVVDARLNIDAAARLFIHNRSLGYGGWGDWACAAANDGFRARSVLPGWPGGPAELPAWAFQY